MATTEMTLNEIRSKGFGALLRELGPDGYVRFIQQFAVGQDDFTARRQASIQGMTAVDVRRMVGSSPNQR